MDASRFDALTRSLAAGTDRRRIIRILTSLGFGGILMHRGQHLAAAQIRIPLCEDCSTCCACCEPDLCPTSQNCCNKCKATKTVSGIGGWGLVRTDEGEVQVGLMASRVGFDDPDVTQYLGQVIWLDRDRGLTLLSSAITGYGPLPGEEGAREVRGTMWVNREGGDTPFVLRAVAGPAGEGRGEVALAVGDQAVEGGGRSGFTYGATGSLVAGGLQLLRLDLADAATPSP